MPIKTAIAPRRFPLVLITPSSSFIVPCISILQRHYEEGYQSSDDETRSIADTEADSLFDSCDDEPDVTKVSNLTSVAAEPVSDTEDDASPFEDEVRRPPEYYLAAAAKLDVRRLRSRRYSPNTQDRLDWVKEQHDCYCTFIRQDPFQCFNTVSAEFLHGFFSWVCYQRRGKGGRRRPGIKHTSSLGKFCKWYQLVYKCETGRKIDDMVQLQGQDVIRLVADEKDLANTKRESATMYVEDLAEFARVLLATREMTFEIGWLRIQLILFCQLAGITGNRPEALVNLRFRHFKFNLIRDPNGSRPRLFIELTAEYTKGYLGSKDANTFPIPEIIFDPTLVPSPHVFLLGMLFKIQAFKSPSIISPEKLYSLEVLDGTNEQPLPLKEELDDNFIFCQAVREAHGVRIAHKVQVTSDSVRYRMKIGGQITGFAAVTGPYKLRDGAAKALNESPDVSESLQNLILQHSSIDTFLKHYLDRRITADVAKIYRGMKPEKDLMRFACSMSRSIDPRRPCKLTTKHSTSVNRLPCIVKLIGRAKKFAEAPLDTQSNEKHQKACRRVTNEKQRQRRKLLVQIVDRFKKEQPVIDSERQLSGKVVHEETREALQRSDQMTPEQLLLIDSILNLPETTLEKEHQRRITAINAVTAYCGVEEGTPSRRVQIGQPANDMTVKPENLIALSSESILRKAVLSIKTDKRPTMCFLCVGNPNLTTRERVVSYANPGSLSRHFLRKHVKKLEKGNHVECR
ncbi:hypothetical protein HYALB_00002180, partial [Hymenoscyphus albidus]